MADCALEMWPSAISTLPDRSTPRWIHKMITALSEPRHFSTPGCIYLCHVGNWMNKGHEIFACVFLFFVFLILSYQNACYGCENAENRTWSEFFLWRTKVSEAVCKCDWHNVRSNLFFNVWKFRTRCAMTLSKWVTEWANKWMNQLMFE